MDQKIRRFGFGAVTFSTEALARGSCARQSSPRNRIKKPKKYNKKIGYTNNRGKIRAVMSSMQTLKLEIRKLQPEIMSMRSISDISI